MQFYQSEAAYVRFDYNIPRGASIGVYARRNALPTHTQYDLLEVLSGFKARTTRASHVSVIVCATAPFLFFFLCPRFPEHITTFLWSCSRSIFLSIAWTIVANFFFSLFSLRQRAEWRKERFVKDSLISRPAVDQEGSDALHGAWPLVPFAVQRRRGSSGGVVHSYYRGGHDA